MTIYFVQIGDTLQSIAKEFKITIQDIFAHNSNFNGVLHSGMTLWIPSPMGLWDETKARVGGSVRSLLGSSTNLQNTYSYQIPANSMPQFMYDSVDSAYLIGYIDNTNRLIGWSIESSFPIRSKVIVNRSKQLLLASCEDLLIRFGDKVKQLESMIHADSETYSLLSFLHYVPNYQALSYGDEKLYELFDSYYGNQNNHSVINGLQKQSYDLGFLNGRNMSMGFLPQRESSLGYWLDAGIHDRQRSNETLLLSYGRRILRPKSLYAPVYVIEAQV